MGRMGHGQRLGIYLEIMSDIHDPTPDEQPQGKTTDQQLAELFQKKEEEKKARVERCAKLIQEACQKENVIIIVPSLNLVEGRIQPVIQLVAMD